MKTIDTDIVIKNIEKIRNYRKYTKKELAELIDMSEENYSRITNFNNKKKRDFKLSDILKVADALNVDVCVFFKRDFNEKTNINGNYNNIGVGNSINTAAENKHLQNEIELLKKTIEDKERIIELLTKGKG